MTWLLTGLNAGSRDAAMNVKEKIEQKLVSAFPDAEIKVFDDSHKHAGHAGARPEGETHFRVVLRSAAFTGLSRLARHRRVMSVLQDELAGPVHALAIKAHTPEEA